MQRPTVVIPTVPQRGEAMRDLLRELEAVLWAEEVVISPHKARPRRPLQGVRGVCARRVGALRRERCQRYGMKALASAMEFRAPRTAARDT